MMNPKLKAIIDEAMRPAPENSICFLIQSAAMGSPDSHWIYTDQDLKVIECRGSFKDEVYKEKWIGQHISKVRIDVETKLYKMNIHRFDGWVDNKEVDKLIHDRRMVQRSYDYTKAHIDNARMKDAHQRNDLEKALLRDAASTLQKIKEDFEAVSLKLNRIRAEHFGDDTTNPPKYFTDVLED